MRPPESESFDSERNLSAHVSIVMSALGSKSDLGARSCEVRFTSMNGHRRAAGHVRKVPSGDMAAAAKPALRLPIVPAWLLGHSRMKVLEEVPFGGALACSRVLTSH
jgi:hypothetical protein